MNWKVERGDTKQAAKMLCVLNNQITQGQAVDTPSSVYVSLYVCMCACICSLGEL